MFKCASMCARVCVCMYARVILYVCHTCGCTCEHSPQGPRGLCSPVSIPVCTARKAHTDCVHLYLYRCPQPTSSTRTVFTDIYTCVHSLQGPHGLCSPLTIPVCAQSTRPSRIMFNFTDICECAWVGARARACAQPTRPTRTVFTYSLPVCAQPTRPTRTVFTYSLPVCAQPTRPTRTAFRTALI